VVNRDELRLTVRARFGIQAAMWVSRMVVATIVLTCVTVANVGCAGASWSRPPAPRSRAASGPPTPPKAECSSRSLQAVVAEVNAARWRSHLGPLATDPVLVRAAHKRARAMAAANRLSHAGWERVVRGEGAVARSIGENVAFNYPTATAVVDGWMQSRGHRANILGTSFRRIGVGCVADARGRLWWAQDFSD
jgi:uncharacterized protein YkwD